MQQKRRHGDVSNLVGVLGMNKSPWIDDRPIYEMGHNGQYQQYQQPSTNTNVYMTAHNASADLAVKLYVIRQSSVINDSRLKSSTFMNNVEVDTLDRHR